MKRYVVILALLGLVSTSCNSKLDIAPPNRITDEELQSVLKDKLDVVTTSLAASIDSRMWAGKPLPIVEMSAWGTYSLNQNLRGNDIMFAFTSQTWNRTTYRLQDYRTAATLKNLMTWQALYADLSAANQVLNYLVDAPEVVDATADAKTQTYQKTLMKNKARALTLRAYSYTYLMWIYAEDYLNGGSSKLGVPMVTVYDPINAKPAARATQDACWQQITDDAALAAKLFKNAEVKSVEKSDDLDATVANTVLARAALTWGKWDLAIAAADAVLAEIPATSLMSKDDYVNPSPYTAGNGFTVLAKNTEKIFMTPYTANGSLSNFNGWMNVFGDPGYGGSRGGFMAMDQRLYDQIAPDDYRKSNFLSAPIPNYFYAADKTTENIPQYSNLKFADKDANAAAPGTTDKTMQAEVFMRLSELILGKAEAQARAGNEAAATTTLDILIAARSDNAYTTASYPWPAGVSTLMQKIQLQWRIEYWGEAGWEYYNNKRWNIGVDRVSAGPTGAPSSHVDAVAKIIVPAGVAFTWQIPEQEMNSNPACVQNP